MLNSRQQYGRFGENLAARFLEKNGYRIRETNYRNHYGEIDIVAEENGTIVFIEVRSRRSDRFGPAKASVNRVKQRKISMVALGYLKTTGKIGEKARFDVVAVSSGDQGDRIELFRNAFEFAYE